MECVEDPTSCARSSGCVTHELWQRLNSAVSGLLSTVTLADLVAQHSARASERLMYHI